MSHGLAQEGDAPSRFSRLSRRHVPVNAQSTFKMPGGVVMCWVVLAFFAFVIWGLTQTADTLHALLVTPVWFAVLGVAWLVVRHRTSHLAREAEFQAELAEPDTSPRA